MADDSPSPLAGLKVIEITSIYSGPMAGMMLAELGADVVKVESPQGPDPLRFSGVSGGPDSVNSIFYSLNRGKRFCSIDEAASFQLSRIGNRSSPQSTVASRNIVIGPQQNREWGREGVSHRENHCRVPGENS